VTFDRPLTPLPVWYLDELAHAGPEHLDPAFVAGYDRKARVDPTDDLAHLRELGLDSASIVIDLGAGTAPAHSQPPNSADGSLPSMFPWRCSARCAVKRRRAA
jgi:hypothetical protein